ncbi:MAG: hypothetical protein IKT58_04125 [Oscillospiraceae bacterium]|nr:hypothetical protein [Oscillospiraceae bacterium]
MRKWIAMTLVAMMLLSLVGCSLTREESKPTVSTEEPTHDTSVPETPTENEGEEENTEGTVPTESVEESTEAPQEMYPIQDQAQVFVANRLEWLNEDELFGYGYHFTMADMDGNGRYELYFGSCQGTGLFTYVDGWEISEDGTTILPIAQNVEEGYSQVDMICSNVDVYYDPATGVYSYLFEDLWRSGAQQSGVELRAWTLKNGAVAEESLGSQISMADMDGQMMEAFVNAQGREITAEEYEQIPAQRFEGWGHMTAELLWQMIDLEELDEMTDEVLTDLLIQCAEAFRVS